jgi:hypothetical protein
MLKKNLVSFAAAGALLLATVGGTSAAGSTTGTINATSTINGGDLTIVGTTDASTVAATLTGDDVYAAGNLGTITVADPRGSGIGWSVQVSSSAFTGTSGPAQGKTLPTDANGNTITVTGVDVTTSKGLGPSLGVSYANNRLIAVGASAVKVFSALADGTGKGMGTFVLSPQVRMGIPAQTFAGTYSGTVTVTLAATP